MSYPVIAITMGDLAGVGPEVVAKALLDRSILGECIPVVVGSASCMAATVRTLGAECDLVPVDAIHREALRAGACYILNTAEISPIDVVPGLPDARWGRAAFRSVEKAVAMALSGSVDAVVTAPISKEGIHLAGLPFQGHTEYLAHLTGAKRYRMMFAGGGLRLVLHTIHIPLKEVFARLTPSSLAETVEVARETAALFGVANPRIAVAGLNPHAGEGGLFGDEDRDIIAPVVAEMRRKGIDVTGPYPPDTVFLSARKGEFDFVVALYHDQALIAFKMVAFDSGVNVTVGLPIIRTSPDHGTAYAIAGKGVADPGSMREAIKLAAALARNKPHS